MATGSVPALADLPGLEKRGIERRVALRYPSLAEAVCQPVGTDFAPVSCSARVWDLSVGGTCLVVGRPFEAGTALLMEIELGPNRFSHTLRAQVVHSAPHLEGLWLVGCEFATPLGDGELQELLA